MRMISTIEVHGGDITLSYVVKAGRTHPLFTSTSLEQVQAFFEGFTKGVDYAFDAIPKNRAGLTSTEVLDFISGVD